MPQQAFSTSIRYSYVFQHFFYVKISTLDSTFFIWRPKSIEKSTSIRRRKYFDLPAGCICVLLSFNEQWDEIMLLLLKLKVLVLNSLENEQKLILQIWSLFKPIIKGEKYGKFVSRVSHWQAIRESIMLVLHILFLNSCNHVF